jgi:hypothetical protein
MKAFSNNETRDNSAVEAFLDGIQAEENPAIARILTQGMLAELLHQDRFFLQKEAAYYRHLLSDLKDAGDVSKRLHSATAPIIAKYLADIDKAHPDPKEHLPLLRAIYYFRQEQNSILLEAELMAALRRDPKYLLKEKMFLKEMLKIFTLYAGLIGPNYAAIIQT